MNFTFQKKNNDEEIIKKENDIFDEIKNYYIQNNFVMTKVKCAKGSDECAPKKEKDLADDTPITSGN